MVTRDDISCPVRLPAEKGQYSKRCHFHTGTDGICPLHGNVSKLLRLYKKTKKLFDESDLEPSLRKETPAKTRTWLGQFLHDVFK